MKYLLLIATDPTVHRDGTDGEALNEEYARFTRLVAESGELVADHRLERADTATSVRVRGSRTALTDGPFAETTEELGGFYIIEVPHLDRAIELAAQIPNARDGVIEVRPIAPRL